MSLDITVPSNLRSRLHDDGAVEVWTARIDDERMTARYEALLDEDERARAGGFVFERHRIRFIQAHGIIRLILGEVLDFRASELRFARGPWGKPRLDMPSLHAVLEFSLSHSGDYCAVAMGRSAVGIDIERIRNVPQMKEIARLRFTPAEIQQITESSGVDRREAFFAFWTRKEAVAKALGIGLGGDTESQLTMESAEPGPISTTQLRSPPGYAATVACLALGMELTERIWNPASFAQTN